MVKPNCDELVQLIGHAPENKKDIKNLLIFLKSKGISIPLVTLGASGCVALVNNNFHHFTVPKVVAKNSVGSGDSTVAGIAVGICKGFSFVDAIRFGMASGVANTQFVETGMVTVELVKHYYDKIIITDF